MSLLQGNFKKELQRIANPDTANQETCPNTNQVPNDLNFHHKHYTEETFSPSPEFCANLEEDERFDFLLRMRKTMTEYFDNTAYANPFGMTNYDYKSIGQSRQKSLENYKMKIRRENYIYMNQHPEIDAMLEALLRKMFKSQPEDPIKYAAEFFSIKQTSHEEHEKIIQEERKNIIRYRKSKSKEFYIPKPDPSLTVRKLNLGPLADPLQWTKESSETPSEPFEKAPEEVKPIKKKCCCECKPMKKITTAQQQIVPQVKKNTIGQEQNAKEEEVVQFFEEKQGSFVENREGIEVIPIVKNEE